MKIEEKEAEIRWYGREGEKNVLRKVYSAMAFERSARFKL